MRLFGPLYDRVLAWSRHPHAVRYLGAMSFAESSFFPIPVDVMLAPMCLADRHRWVRYATVATVFSVLGGLAGYFIGYGMFEVIEPWLRESHYWDAYVTSREWFDEYGVLVVFVAGFSPIPYKVFTIAAGVASLSIPGFLLASLVGRAARFFLVAGLVRAGGEKFETTLSRHIERLGWGTVVASIALIAWLMMRGQ
ncbi:MAG: DedA family protein [Woeseiaceae bacterium]|nr:DedA family protein [Woeseiaceae bacterium]